ncbi:sugar phosphate isomerase/epimerase family protein [Herbiconiux sp. KACC 21604]|uniref:sugar phosphate isomerase/epimerase family protein n=1 Tax=unclassified Herbiconiux TaxID=2618217 RepID=UPI001492A85C|nr:sugar phosphate isomerase/epimerase family protein [Herbiconiux sp. SALV-R1]QJU55234.1 sugar phosphate isomerase/epimerase [Herbiconiux sp. SALV-R1]WPO86400.1 sugar phosphate isomerase/epimerase family protein [Herbiconiux sp. KACC 21604]
MTPADASAPLGLPIAVNTFVWHSPLDDERLARTVATISEWGYEGIELAFENPGDWDAHAAAELLHEHGLVSAVGAVLGPGRELAAADPEVIAATSDYLRRAIDVAQLQGSGLVIGPMYTSVGRTGRIDAAARRAAIAELRDAWGRLGDYAGERGVRLAVEPLNRYETSLFNTTEQLLEAIDPLPAETVGLNLDTYHMNIEETSLSAAFDLAGDRLLHLQVCGNDRGVPLRDHLDWAGIRDDLVRIGYRGMLGFESFTADNASIATAASIWRPFAPTQDDLARETLAELRAWRATF